jgi:hypothetical protein
MSWMTACTGRGSTRERQRERLKERKGVSAVTTGPEIWKVLRNYLPRGQWIDLEKVFGIVESKVTLDAEDLSRRGPGSLQPRWKTTVRTLMRLKKQAGVIRGRPGGDLPRGHS